MLVHKQDYDVQQCSIPVDYWIELESWFKGGRFGGVSGGPDFGQRGHLATVPHGQAGIALCTGGITESKPLLQPTTHFACVVRLRMVNDINGEC